MIPVKVRNSNWSYIEENMVTNCASYAKVRSYHVPLSILAISSITLPDMMFSKKVAVFVFDSSPGEANFSVVFTCPIYVLKIRASTKKTTVKQKHAMMVIILLLMRFFLLIVFV